MDRQEIAELEQQGLRRADIARWFGVTRQAVSKMAGSTSSTPPPTEHVQGRPVSYVTYVKHRCRCVGCRAANAAYHREYQKR